MFIGVNPSENKLFCINNLIIDGANNNTNNPIVELIKGIVSILSLET